MVKKKQQRVRNELKKTESMKWVVKQKIGNE